MRRKVIALLATATIATLTLAGQASAVPSEDASAAGTGTAAVKSTLRANQTISAPFTLNRNQSVSSNTARLIMQSDGNLVIYDEFNRARWASNTVNQGWTARFQTDGNFVVYTASNRAVWASNTAGHPGSRLVVQDDGNVVIYDGSQAIWASNTNH
ncbi:bulb-type lectin domain-containing protein [Streptomyces sp. NPDC006476]|uniref:bulb-type lectin domain-containing protein n=1 Tax=Streptomyces sp. NPDC006476 TaxID=3157175 RepID=UPI0033A642E3